MIVKSRALWSRLAGAAGLLFVAVIVGSNLALLARGGPAPGADHHQAVSFYAHSPESLIVAAALPLGWIASTVFAAGVLTQLRVGTDRGADLWLLTGFSGVLAQNITFATIVAIRIAVGVAGHLEGAPLVWAFHDAVFGLNGTFLAMAMIGFGVAGLTAGRLTRWHAGAGFLGAALQLTSACLTPLSVSGGPVGLIGLVGWLLWVAWLVAFAVPLLRRGHFGTLAR